MGKWDHRPRRFFRQRRSPPPTFYDINAPLPEFWQDGVPLWEKKYCTLIGLVPWQKIVDSKKLMFCHSNVVDWNDSAAKEAFQNAKKRYWSQINSLPCDISLPDPITFIDQIDWNPCIDPELIKELDSAYFALADEEQGDTVTNKRAKLSADGENPWECTGTPLSKALDNKARGWNQGDDHADNSGNVDHAGNPWECSIVSENGGLRDSAWEGGRVKAWDWNEGRGNNNKDWDSGYSPWGNDHPGVHLENDIGWGKGRDSSWRQHQSSNLAKIGNSWERKSGLEDATPTATGWRKIRPHMSGWKQQENGNFSSDTQFRRRHGSWNAPNQSFERREGSNRHTFGYNGSQFRRDIRQTGHYWRGENSKRRDFAA